MGCQMLLIVCVHREADGMEAALFRVYFLPKTLTQSYNLGGYEYMYNAITSHVSKYATRYFERLLTHQTSRYESNQYSRMQYNLHLDERQGSWNCRLEVKSCLYTLFKHQDGQKNRSST